MPVYLSPGVFPREIDISLIPSSQGPLRPAFIGTAKKGPMNTPVLIASASQYIDTFGEPIPESYLGYAVLSYMQEGNACYVLRVGVEHKEGLDATLLADAVDTSGARKHGWGRIPVYAGIDYGKIFLRPVSVDNPVIIHAASAGAVTKGTQAGNDGVIMNVSGTYTGAYDELFTVYITGSSTETTGTGIGVANATYQISTTNGGIVANGRIGDDGLVQDLVENYGLTLNFGVGEDDKIEAGQLFTFAAHPDNQALRVTVEDSPFTIQIGTGTYNTAEDLVAAITSAVAGGTAETFTAVVDINSNGDEVPTLRTNTAGEWIQVTGTAATCAELGLSTYSYDIPRSFLLGLDAGTYSFNSTNNRVVLDIIQAAATKRLDFMVNTGVGTTVTDLVNILNAQGTAGGVIYFKAMAFTIPGGTTHPLIVTPTGGKYDQLKLQATWTYLATSRFAEEVGIRYPYTKTYQSFWDARTTLPAEGTGDYTGQPAACDPDSASYSITQCALDTAYYENVVGWFVAKTPGTWANGYSIGVELFTDGVGDAAGRYKVSVLDPDGVLVDAVTDVTFNPDDTRYIGNVANEGSPIGGINGNAYYQWEMRSSFLTDDGTVRLPAPFRRFLAGGANGIPTDAAYSEALDDAVIGNPGLATGIHALGNPESYDFNLLAIPGFTSGAVIGQALQFCENRGDVLFLVDPPQGMRPQQVIEWHNGMLPEISELAAAINSSYGALYWGWLKISDQFNGGTIWVPPCGHVASVFARTARETEQWFAPAGLNRGRLLTAIDVEYNPTLGERDALYGSGNAVNPIVKFVQDGITIWGQRTLQRKASALDRVNVRMLLIYVKKNLQRSLRSFIFEPNDRTTRKQVTSTCDGFLADIVARRGLTAYKVVCDDTNNTPERVDRNELWVTVFLQPTRVAEFIALNLVIMRTGANFSAQEALV